jgi:diacylglycerol O-acyltransferase / wax synthase
MAGRLRWNDPMGKAGNGGYGEPMSKVDTAWLRMESPTNLMMITGVWMLATPLSLHRLRTVMLDRFLAYRRFRQKAVDGEHGAFWAEDEAFDIDRHVVPIALPAPGDQHELEKLVSRLASTPLDHDRPLWQFHLVEHYLGGSAVIPRIHHCYADGIALVQVVLSMMDVSAHPGRVAPLREAWLADDGHRVAQRLASPAREQLDRALKFGGKLLDKGIELTRHPFQAAELAREGGAMASELAHALSLADDPPTALKAPLGGRKHCAWAEPLDLDEVKAVSRGADCTVNDVLLAAAAGALRAHLLARGDPIEGLTIRATVPVNLRPLEHAKKLGNHFGLVFLDLPIGEPNPVRRLERVAASMRELKNSRQAIVTYGILAALGMAPPGLQRAALDLLSRKATAVATNVPGPQMPLYLGGARVDEMMFWVPQSGGIGLGISILSYHGRVHFGLMSDDRCVAKPQQVIRRFRPEFEKLLYATLMEDWQQPIDADACAATLRHYG